VIKTEKRLQLMATNPGDNPIRISVVRLHRSPLRFLTFFRCKSLHCISCVATRNPTVYWNLCFWKNSLYCT